MTQGGRSVTQKVANIEREAIDISIRYFHTLEYVTGGMSLCSRWWLAAV